MTNLRSQRRLAARILNVGENRVWMDPNKIDDVEAAITREEIRKLVHEGTIQPLPKNGVSRGRARVLHEKKKRGRRRGVGSRTGGTYSRIARKEAWVTHIRALRERLDELRAAKTITPTSYRQTYKMASSGRFESIADLENYLKSREMWRKR